MLAEDVVLRSDGGGKVAAARRPIFGRDKVSRFIAGVMRKQQIAESGAEFRPERINGLPGFVMTVPGVESATVAIESDGRLITGIYIVVNPEKVNAALASKR